MAIVGLLVRNVWRLMIPGGLILAAAIAAPRYLPDHETLATLAVAYPYFALVAGLVLAWRFDQGRLVLAAIALVAAQQGLELAGAEPLVAATIAVLVPLVLGLLALLPEPGLSSLGTVSRLALIAGGAAAVALARQPEHAPLAKSLTDDFAALARYTAWTEVPHLALALFAAFGLLIWLRFVLRADPLDSGFLWGLAASLLALHHDTSNGRAALFATTILILAIAVIERSHAMAYRDPLTGLPGRRALEERLDRLRGRFAVAMIDIDHFKRVNDRHGHDTGDQVLRMVAGHLAHAPGGGKAYRYGGEEFALVFPRSGAASAGPHLDELRQRIAGSRFAVRGKDRPRRKPKGKRGGPEGSAPQQLKVTVSIGVAERDAKRTDPDAVLRAADKALYRAKGGGRNQVRAA